MTHNTDNLYNVNISIGDILLNKIATDVLPTHLQAMLEKHISKGISRGLYECGIDEYIPTTSINVSVSYHEDEWHRCSECLPDYGVNVLVCLSDGSTRVITHRTRKDYSKDIYDFLHISICEDAMYWMPLPDTPKNIRPNHTLKEQ